MQNEQLLSSDNPEIADALIALANNIPFEASNISQNRGLKQEIGINKVQQTRIPTSPLGSEENGEIYEEYYDQDSEETEDEDEKEIESPSVRSRVDPSELKFATSRELRKRKEDDDLWKPNSYPKKSKRQKLNANQSSSEQQEIDYPRRRKSHKPDSKLSFQEAAIQVMIDQQKKGKFALTTREIWELIQLTGLVDTKCKTPVSSLSSRITEDVRTKGNKSVFIRVGEGLYSLRQGLSPEQLEQFLALQNHHQNHLPLFSPKIRETTVTSDQDLSPRSDILDSPSDFITSHKGKQAEESPNKKKTHLTASPLQSLPDNSLNSTSTNKISWSGLPLAVKPHFVYYSALNIGSHTYRIGDYAYFKPNSESENPYVGKIIKFWQSNNFSNKEKESQMFVKCIWYYYPEETHLGRTKKHHKKELFLSNLEDVNTVNSLIAPLKVVTYSEFLKLHQLKAELKDTYFCRCAYIGENFIPFQVDESNGNVDLELSELEECPIALWPQDLIYSNSLIFTDIHKDQFKELNCDLDSQVELQISQGQKNTNRSPPLKFSLVAKNDIQAGCIIGEYTGLLRIIPKESQHQPSVNPSLPNGQNKVSLLLNPTSSTDPSKVNSSSDSPTPSDSSVSSSLIYEPYVLVLYEDESNFMVIDATKYGNEFRFLEDSSLYSQPNVILSPHRKHDKQWNLFVLTIAPIKKGNLIVADFSKVKKRRK